MSTADLIVSCVCEAKPKPNPKDVVGTHSTPYWLGRVPKEDVPAVVRFLKNQGIRPRVIYRDKSTDRPRRYGRGRTFVSGWAHKSNATHADIYDQGPQRYDVDYMGLSRESAAISALKAGLNGKQTTNPSVLNQLAKKPNWAYMYAKKAIKGRWSQGEEAIAKDPKVACKYAKDVIKGRFLHAEETIAQSEFKDLYLRDWPDAKDDWTANGWIDWLD